MLLTNTLNWAEFARKGMERCTAAALSWMFRNGDLPWDDMLYASAACVIRKYNLTHGILVNDDSDRRRAKKTKRIYGTHKVFDQKTGGYFNGQCLKFLMRVTEQNIIAGWNTFLSAESGKAKHGRRKTSAL